MAPNWSPEQQAANDAEVEVIVFEIIESVVKWTQERRERETLEAVTKNIMDMVVDIPNDSCIPVLTSVIVYTSEGPYTMTDGQVYWNGRNRAQCLSNGSSNNRGLGYVTPKGRNEHIHKAHGTFSQPNTGDRNGQYYEVL
ncbi:hypothetical protein KCU77_g127, partial [Aureobasidium melanogenum]